ncbi:MAG TPA: c-type cytochrome biogenesis protein CcmI [Vineibacter sp.]|nr:c-type cytochrome biogenesis protein CcmI [Vineibacter sp.]
MLLPLILALLTALAIAALLLPLLRRRIATTRRFDHDLAIYNDQLAEIERERASGALNDEEAKAARVEIERRILAAGDAGDALAQAGVPRRRFLPAAIAILVPVAALGIYFQIGSPDLPARPFAERPQPPAARTADAAPMDMVRRLRERIEKDPRDVEARLALGRAQLSIGRVKEALESFRAAQQIAPERADIMSALGEALTFESDGVVTQPAREMFAAAVARDPKEAGARFYLGLADAQGGDAAGALRRWLELEADTPDGAPWLETLQREIERVSKQAGIDPRSIRPDRKERKPRDAGMPQPSADDVKRMEQLPPAERDAQIRAMVDRLADRLKEAPEDVDGWLRLARARGVLGQHAEADQAYANADKLQPDNPHTLASWAETRLRLDDAGMKPLSPQTVTVLRRLEKLQPNNGLALFFLAQVDEAAGDKAAALRRLRRLQQLLPADAPIRGTVEKRVQSLEGK